MKRRRQGTKTNHLPSVSVTGVPGTGIMEPLLTGPPFATVCGADALTFVVGTPTSVHVAGATAGVLSTMSSSLYCVCCSVPTPSTVTPMSGNASLVTVLDHTISTSLCTPISSNYGVPPGPGLAAVVSAALKYK